MTIERTGRIIMFVGVTVMLFVTVRLTGYGDVSHAISVGWVAWGVNQMEEKIWLRSLSKRV
jgi:hypothetical protein